MAEMSLNELAGFLFLQIVEFSDGSAETILDGKPSKLKKFVSRFSRDPQKERDLFKLYFHLLIAYLAVVVVDLQMSDYFRPHAKRIIDRIVELFYTGLKQPGGAPDNGLVAGDEFIRDDEERAIVLMELRRVDPAVFGTTPGLPRLGLTAVADFLLETRLNQYREIWIDDICRIGQDGFIALMPTKVYQHWTGGNPRSPESISFGILLFAGLMPFSTAISQALDEIELKT